MNINLGKLEKNKDLLYIVAVIILVIIVYFIIKKGVTSVGDFLTFGTDVTAKKEAIAKNEDRIKAIKVNTKNLKFTLQTYDNWANMIHQELLNSTWLKPPNGSLIRGVFRNINTIDGLNQLKKSFGVRENMDLFQYLRKKLGQWNLDSSVVTINQLNDIFKSKGNLKSIKI